MLQAISASLRSEDPDTQVGACVICKNGDVKVGYNGSAPGFKLPDVSRDEKLNFAVHAEVNVLSFLRRGDADTIYITISPCVSCTLNIIAHGIKRIVYLKEYHRCQKFKDTCNYYGIKYEQIEPLGISTILTNLEKFAHVGNRNRQI
jgi:dCMP deaminase